MIGFATPWLLTALVALPLLWLILRAIPPAPIRRRFPGVALLLGLRDDDSVSDRTPWWLLALRMLAVAAMIVGLAGPVLNPQGEAGRSGPLLIVTDGGWAGADRLAAQVALAQAQIETAGRAGRTVALLQLTRPEPLVFQTADALRARLPGLTAAPWSPGPEQTAQALDAVAASDGGFETRWFSDGLEFEGRADLLAALEARGDVTVHRAGGDVLALAPVRQQDGALALTALRAGPGPSRAITLLAKGRDPGGTERVLARVPALFAQGETEAQASLTLPAELQARVTRFEIADHASAGAVTLAGDGLRRREVALISGRRDREGLELLSPMHYLRQALAPTADLLEGAVLDLMPARPDVVILADVARLSDPETRALAEWVEAGGMLLRFAGPRLAASDLSRSDEDPLMPVRLRAGGRMVGGAMSWGEPKTLAPFANGSPFFGLRVPDEVSVTAQVMAQPDPALAERVVAALSDGTPLVTRKALGRGQIVLFHVTANAEWSNLPLSGLFVEMLERLAVSSAATPPEPSDLEGTTWTPLSVLEAGGRLRDAGTRPGVDGADLLSAPLGPDLYPGLYQSEDRRIARNVIGEDTALMPAVWPARIPVEGLDVTRETPLAGMLLSLALLLLVLDVAATLALSGRMRGATGAATLLLGAVLMVPAPVGAQTGRDEALRDLALSASAELVLAHVRTADARVDGVAGAGLQGLSDTLFFRTSVEPANPAMVDLERDELSVYPMLYWPVTTSQPLPSDEAYARINAYLRSGGLIVFDTRDSDVAGLSANSPNQRKLQQLAAPLDIPPLEPVPSDHVLTRTFYLLQDFPGRYPRGRVWVEAAPPNSEQIEGMPFRNLNDGVTPVVIGGADWAAAWATGRDGQPLLPVGRGRAGDRQREMAYRFGVNLVMHVLTGNYKSDQVHVPALLDRLSQ